MDHYLLHFDNYEEAAIYDFKLGDGGIGDCIKHFVYLLEKCMEKKKKIYYLINDAPIEKYLILKHNKMYIRRDEFKNLKKYYIYRPQELYKIYQSNNNLRYDTIFTFSQKIVNNSLLLLPKGLNNYISLHLRLGDKHLETNKYFVICKNDVRKYNINKIDEIIKNNDNIIFFCDNNEFKEKMREKHNKLIILNSKIGHTSLKNTSESQIIDTITEFYIMTNSQKIIAASNSGFSSIASKFKKIPFSNI